ncbi:MAG: hypothetical protein LR011_09035 [Verrucomicrobia bacterium]|nr:hypothetical protein [Verrucomicrobiota bacterium]
MDGRLFFYAPQMILLLVLLVILAFPIVLLIAGFRSRQRPRSMGSKLLIGSGAALCLIYGAGFVQLISAIGPGQSGLLASGTTPEGREYCVVQTFKSWIEPYQVSLYARDETGLWHWKYLEHEANSWQPVEVTFAEGKAQVFSKGALAGEVDLPSQTVDLDSILPGYRDHYISSDASIEDLVHLHNKKYANKNPLADL